MTTLFERLRIIDRKIDQLADRLEPKSIRLYPTIVGPIMFIVLAITIFLVMPSQVKIREDQIINARTFPTVLTTIMLAGAVILLGKELFRIVKKLPLEVVELSVLTEIKALILLGLLILYAVLMKSIGFITSSVIYAVLMLYYFRIKDWKYYGIVVTASVAIGMIFRYVLHVRLP